MTIANKKLTILIALFPLALYAQEEADSSGISVSGSIESNIYIPQYDEAIGTERYDEWALTNTYANVDVESRYIDAGARFEFLKHPLPGYEEQFRGWGVPYYYIKGLYYQGVQKLDSAIYFYRKLLNPRLDIEDVEMGYKGLMSVYHHLGMSDSTLKYADLYTQANDSASILHSADEITRMQALYNYNESQRIAAEKSAEANRYKFLLLFSGAVFILFAHLINRYIKKQKRLKSEEMAAVNAKYADTLEQYETAQREFDALRQSSEQFLEKKQQDIEQLQEALALYQADKVNPADWGLERSLLEGDIVKELRLLAAHAKTPTDLQWQALHTTVSEHLPEFYEEVTKSQHHLTEKEVNVCILIKLRFIPTEIATLLDITKQRVSNIRRSINHKLFHEEVAKTLDSNIRRLKS